jgi:hypothetical protein
MFEGKSTESKRKSVHNKNVLNKLNTEIDKIDIEDSLPLSTRKKSSSIVDKIQKFNKGDQKDTEKILKTVSNINTDMSYLKVKLFNPSNLRRVMMSK